MAVKRGKMGVNQNYNGIAQHSRQAAAAGAERPGGGGVPGEQPCVLYLKLHKK